MTGVEPYSMQARWSKAIIGLIAVTVLSQILVAMDFALLNVSLPAIERALNLETERLHWIIGGRQLAIGGFMILGGRLSDTYGARRCLMAGIVLCGVGAVVCFTCVDVEFLFAGQALQGLGTALYNPAVVSLILATFADEKTRNKMLSIYVVFQSVGGVIGFVLGGAVVSLYGWRAIFLFDYVIVAALICATLLIPAHAPARSPSRLDIPGAILITVGCVLLVLALSSIGRYGWDAPLVLGSGAVSMVMLALFVVVEAKAPAPLVPLTILRLPNFVAANLVNLCAIAVASGMLFMLSLFLQHGAHYTAQQSGIMFLPKAAATIVAGIVVTTLLKDLSPRRSMIMGLVILLTIMLLLSRIAPETAPIFTFIALCLFPFGMVLSSVGAMNAGTAHASSTQQGIASAVILTGSQISVSLGLAIYTSAMQSRTPTGIEQFSNGFLAGAGIAALGLLVALLGFRPRYSGDTGLVR